MRRGSLATFCALQFASCVPSFDVPLERLDETVVHGAGIDVHWWTTSTITTIHEHVEVVKDGEVRKISELNAGGIDSIGISGDSIVVYSGGGLFYQLEDTAFGYRVVLDTVGRDVGYLQVMDRRRNRS